MDYYGGILQRPRFALEPRSTAPSGAQSIIENNNIYLLENLRNAQYNVRILARTCKRSSKSFFGDNLAHRNLLVGGKGILTLLLPSGQTKQNQP
jgi:hypothetical protein